MKQLLIIFFFLSISLSQKSQELVQNGSFEDISLCPSQLSSSGYFSYVSGNDTLHDFIRLAAPWYCPTSGTSDLFNSCATSISTGVPLNTFGSADAFDGDGYASIICYQNMADDWENETLLFDYTEYIQAPLIEPLIPGATYKASFSVRRGSFSRFAIDQLGLAVHEGPQVAGDSIYAERLELTPVLLTPPGQVITNSDDWQLFEAEFTPSTPVDHLTIGRFEKFIDLEIEEMTTEILSVVLRRAVYYFEEISIELISIPSGVQSNEQETWKVHYAKGRLTYISTESQAGPFSILDSNGQLVYSGTFEIGPGQIDVPLTRGIYLIQTNWGVTRFSTASPMIPIKPRVSFCPPSNPH